MLRGKRNALKHHFQGVSPRQCFRFPFPGLKVSKIVPLFLFLLHTFLHHWFKKKHICQLDVYNFWWNIVLPWPWWNVSPILSHKFYWAYFCVILKSHKFSLTMVTWVLDTASYLHILFTPEAHLKLPRLSPFQCFTVLERVYNFGIEDGRSDCLTYARVFCATSTLWYFSYLSKEKMLFCFCWISCWYMYRWWFMIRASDQLLKIKGALKRVLCCLQNTNSKKCCLAFFILWWLQIHFRMLLLMLNFLLISRVCTEEFSFLIFFLKYFWQRHQQIALFNTKWI